MQLYDEVYSFTKYKLLCIAGRAESEARAALANLRRGVGRRPGELPQLYGELLQDMPEEMYSAGSKPSYAEWAVYMALTLYAMHQQGKDVKTDNMNRENVSLGNAASELVADNDKEVERIKDDYDFIIIDCPPSLNTLTVNAMTTADTVIVPIQCEYYALEGLSELMYTIQLVKERLNNELEIEGIVFTMYDARTCLSLQVVENVKENIDKKIYKSIIPRNVRLAEAPSYGQPINLYSPRSAGAEAYRALADEVIARK